MGPKTPQIHRLYDRLGRLYDLASLVEARARGIALGRLEPQPGARLLNVGCGTGLGSRQIEARLPPQASLISIDLSCTMVRLTKSRVASPVLQADLLHLPLLRKSVDWLWSAFVLDLLPATALEPALQEYRRVLDSRGRLFLLSMTGGVDPVSRTVIAIWEALYSIQPSLCAGCRPLDLCGTLEQIGFHILHQETVVQWGFPVQVLLARRSQPGRVHA